MTLSQLITKLKTLQELHGDVDVVDDDGNAVKAPKFYEGFTTEDGDYTGEVVIIKFY